MEELKNGTEFTFVRETEPPKNIHEVLIDGEEAIACYKTLRDFAVVTNKRIILADKQGMTGKKVEMYTIPYKSINMYSTENARGIMDLGELQIWTRMGMFKFNLKKGVNIRKLDRIIASHLL